MAFSLLPLSLTLLQGRGDAAIAVINQLPSSPKRRARRVQTPSQEAPASQIDADAASLRRKQRAARASIAASALLALAKLLAGLASGSLALLSEAGHALLDTAATILTFFAIREAARPADAEHQFGHAKLEPLAALAETSMLLALATFVIIEAIQRLANPHAVNAGAMTFAVLMISVLVDAWRWHGLAKVAREESSEALAADALHFSSDMVSSVLVLIGLIAQKFGFMRADSVAALGVALFIGLAGWRLARRTIDSLIDAAPLELTEDVRRLIEATPGVMGLEALRLRAVGPRILGDIVVSVGRSMPLVRVGEMKAGLTQALAKLSSKLDVTITANPVVLDDESILEQVLLVAARRRVPVHHVTVQNVEGKIAISLDMEVNGAIPHSEAHNMASRLEAAIKHEIGGDIEVETHIEPMQPEPLAGHDADKREVEAVTARLRHHADRTPGVSDVHHVRVRDTPQGRVINYHAYVTPTLSVNEVHELIDQIDHAVRLDVAGITRIVGHAEPLLPKYAEQA